MVRRFILNYVKSIKINSGRAIQNLVWAISAQAALPLGGPKPSFSWFAWVTAQAWPISRTSCQGLHLLSLMTEFPIVKLITFYSEYSSQKILLSDKIFFQLSNYDYVLKQVLTHPLNPCVACTLCQYMSISLTHITSPIDFLHLLIKHGIIGVHSPPPPLPLKFSSPQNLIFRSGPPPIILVWNSP